MKENRTLPGPEEEPNDLMDLVNGNGPWQWLILLVFFLCFLPDGGTNMAMTFFAPNLEHWCARPPGTNLSVQEWKEIALPPDDPQCSKYKFINISLDLEEHFKYARSSNETVSCDSWEFDDSFYISTIVSQYNLVCEREWLISLSKSVFIIGYMISSSIFAYLADRFGRKPIIMMCNTLAIVSGICTLLSPSFLMFAVSRIFAAAGVTGASSISCILMIELVSPEYRSVYFIGFALGWVLGALQLPLIAWLLRDWVWMETFIIVPSVLVLFCWRWIPESPRWLAHGKTDKAVKVLSKAAQRNGINISDMKLKEIVLKIEKSCEDESPSSNVLQLFHKELRLRTFLIWFIWCAVIFVYYGMSYNTNEMVGDPLINFTLNIIVEIPASIIPLTVIQYKGRRRPLALSFGCAALACVLIYPIPQDPWWIRTCMSLFGKFSIACALYISILFTYEIFPTLLRNIGYGSASTVSRIAAILAPFTRELERASHPVVPQIVFGIVSIASAGLALLLPETTNCSVPESVQAAAHISRKNIKTIQRREK